MKKETTKQKLDVWVIPRLILFVMLSAAISTPLRILSEAVIEGKKGAPEFITAGFLIYGVCAELVHDGYRCLIFWFAQLN